MVNSSGFAKNGNYNLEGVSKPYTISSIELLGLLEEFLIRTRDAMQLTRAMTTIITTIKLMRSMLATIARGQGWRQVINVVRGVLLQVKPRLVPVPPHLAAIASDLGLVGLQRVRSRLPSLRCSFLGHVCVLVISKLSEI